MIDTSTLKDKVLDFALRGMLTAQCKEDGTAQDLYESIQEDKKKLLKEGKIEKIKLIPITETDIPYAIPDNWKWIRWGDLSERIQYGYNAPGKQSGRIKMVRISDIQDGKVMWDTVPYCDIEEDEIDNYLLHENDILFARTGGTVGKSYIVGDVPEEAVFAGYLIRTSYSDKLCSKYMKYFMESKLYWKQLQNGTVATAQPNCNGKTLSKMMLPLPPYREQIRIVDIIDSVFEAIDELQSLQDQYIADRNTLKSKLIDAAIQGKLTEQLPEDGTAESLLEEIEKEKDSLVKAKKIKKTKELSDIEEGEIPFEIPSNWKWVKIGEAFTLQAGKNITAPEIKDEPDDSYCYLCYGGNGVRGYVTQSNVSGRHVLIGRQGALCGNINMADGDFYATEHAVVVYQYADTDPDWAGYVLKALNLNQYATSVAQPGLAVGKIEKVWMPLPPVAEQKRIARTIENLLAAINIAG